ncbi:hypothetical protein TNCV_1932851 [Trichonephila clavipes]|nr:hypothetical protein TNCV_1932851 [Trichonephila clavipes]
MSPNPAGSRHLRSVSQDSRINLYLNEELLNMLIVYESADYNGHITRCLHQERYLNWRVPHNKTIASVNRKLHGIGFLTELNGSFQFTRLPVPAVKELIARIYGADRRIRVGRKSSRT